MDSKSTIRQYISGRRGTRIACIVLAVLMIAALAGGLVYQNIIAPKKAELFTGGNMTKDEAAYLEVVAVSPWVYKLGGDSYYFVEEADGDVYVALLDDAILSKMEAQQAYWKNASGEKPAPYRLYGEVDSTPSGFKLANPDARKADVPFDPVDGAVGQIAYLDIVGVSPWIYRKGEDVYYCAEDKDGYLFTLRLNSTMHDEMQEQQDYWLRETQDAPQPAPYRLYGFVEETSQSVQTNLCQWWEIDTSAYSEWFGTKHLNPFMDAFGSRVLDGTQTPMDNISSILYVCAFFFFLFFLAFGIDLLTTDSRAKSCLASLEQQGLLDQAAQQLDSLNTFTMGKDSARFTQDFAFGSNTGLALPYKDILWCYQRDTRRNFSVVSSALIVCTRAKQGLVLGTIPGKDTENQIAQAMMLIAQHNPSVQVGFTGEARKAYKQAKKQG